MKAATGMDGVPGMDAVPGMGAFLEHAWYFAGWSTEIEREPLQRRICGQDIVFFRDGRGLAHALGAACPHRGANLGQGRVVGDTIQCPFHGWRFGTDGACTHIPSQPDSLKIAPTAAVPRYSLEEKQGCLWIWPARDGAPFEPVPELAGLEPSLTEGLVRSRSELVASPFVNVVENAFDESHVHFLHPRTLGIPTPLVPRQIVTRDDDGRGVSVRWDMESPWGHELFEAYDHPRGRLAGWIQKRTGKQLHGERRWGFRLGGLVSFYERYDTGKSVHVIGAVTPMDEEHTWFTTALSHPVAKSVPQWLVKLWARTLNAEDRTGTTGLLRDANSLTRPVSVAADRGPLLFRRILEQAKRLEIAPLSRFAHAEANGNRDAPEHVRERPGTLDRPNGGAVQGSAPR